MTCQFERATGRAGAGCMMNVQVCPLTSGGGIAHLSHSRLNQLTIKPADFHVNSWLWLISKTFKYHTSNNIWHLTFFMMTLELLEYVVKRSQLNRNYGNVFFWKISNGGCGNVSSRLKIYLCI